LGKEMKFKKEKKSNLLGQTEVTFTQIQNEADKPVMPVFTITARASGVTIFGTMQGELEDRAELDHFAQAVSAAWIEHQSLQKAIREELTRR
jgi:hypothetical protein